MWFWVVLGAVVLVGLLAWSRKPHHHRTGGMSARGGYHYSRVPQDLPEGDKRPNHPLPGEYDGD